MLSLKKKKKRVSRLGCGFVQWFIHKDKSYQISLRSCLVCWGLYHLAFSFGVVLCFEVVSCSLGWTYTSGVGKDGFKSLILLSPQEDCRHAPALWVTLKFPKAISLVVSLPWADEVLLSSRGLLVSVCCGFKPLPSTQSICNWGNHYLIRSLLYVAMQFGCINKHVLLF